MAKFYFMDQEFSSAHFDELCVVLREVRDENENDYSWSWFYDYFFLPQLPEEAGFWASDESSTVRTNLLHFVARIYRYNDQILKQTGLDEAAILQMIKELLGIVEASKNHFLSFWAQGDESHKQELDEQLATLPSDDQMKRVLELPHLTRMRGELPEYYHNDEKTALKRYRNELADFNRRKKLAQKNQQRSAATGSEAVEPDVAV